MSFTTLKCNCYLISKVAFNYHEHIIVQYGTGNDVPQNAWLKCWDTERKREGER